MDRASRAKACLATRAVPEKPERRMPDWRPSKALEWGEAKSVLPELPGKGSELFPSVRAMAPEPPASTRSTPKWGEPLFTEFSARRAPSRAMESSTCQIRVPSPVESKGRASSNSFPVREDLARLSTRKYSFEPSIPATPCMGKRR
ncbi:MAG: hypothetical protein A2636_01495 [Elusimicrobia bacterium RIFCSPHIGHO2_01_FULL_64_10]|nr:MAG: hypothetical protein A2636_01495 [Elusimicrobia bacterium RIFCSPHIGHO2_01_FULL_64_10]